ncbi:MAG: radical SAM protein [Candidatus Marinimicrobia bacterium]|nr:radical SAM protein [Candidatus Neomarinimicrobiota bacterium]
MIPRKNIARAVRKSISQPSYALSNLNHRLRSTLSYHFSNGKSYWPETISLFLTYSCNLRCYMCGQWGEEGVFKNYGKDILKIRLSLKEIETLINDVKHFKPNITLFGGEPMLYPNWIKVVESIKSAGLRCNIISNSVLISRWAQEMVDIGLDEIIFSLDGPEEIHDKIRRVPGTFKKSIEGFHILSDLKYKNNTNKPLININSTLSEISYKYIDKIISIAEDINTDGLTFHHLLFLNKDTVGNFINTFKEQFVQTPSDWLGFIVEKLPEIDIDYLIKKIHQINKNKYKTDVTFYPNLGDCEMKQWYSQFPFKATSYKNRCLSLWMTAYIFPDGSVRPYHTMNYSLGNIRKEKFTAIWNNSKYRKYRSYIKKNKNFSICSKGCTELFRY